MSRKDRFSGTWFCMNTKNTDKTYGYLPQF